MLRFCRARKFEIEKVIIMFDAYMQVRAEHNLDDLPNYVFEESDAVNKIWARGFYGVDFIGRPIYIDCSGKIDVNTLF